MNLVYSLRSRDGGSHYDRELPESAYLDLKTDAQGGKFFDSKGSPGVVIKNAHTASMRQIAHELDRSISAAL
jgi:hypothetical protein